MKILIFGCSGFIGSHLTENLLNNKYSIIGIDMYDDKIKDLIKNKNLSFVQCDIRKPNFNLDKLVEQSDLVIDLIAYANPGLYVKIPLEIFRLNFTENLKIADACVRYRKRLIQFSTCEVYGKTVVSIAKDDLPNPEHQKYATFSEDNSSFILGPVNKHRWIYACAKQLLERVLHAYGLEYGFNYTIIRPFNFIGPKIDYLLDETDGVPRVFSFFMDSLLSGRPMKLVDGGEHRRCYTYIDDAIDCIARIIENPHGVCDQQIFNIGTPGNEISIRQLAELMRTIYSEKFSKIDEPLPEIVKVSSDDFYGKGYEDSDRRIPDISKAQSLLGWEPKWGLPEMLEKTMYYYMNEYLAFYRKKKSQVPVHDIVMKALDLKPAL